VGHLNAANLPQGYPQFFASGEGATLVDVDGRRFIDFMCAWGPNYLGYRHPEVQEAVQRQLKAGRLPERPRENIPDVNSGVHTSNPLCSTRKSAPGKGKRARWLGGSNVQFCLRARRAIQSLGWDWWSVRRANDEHREARQ
jgi:hypothetical protein